LQRAKKATKGNVHDQKLKREMLMSVSMPLDG